MLLDMAISFASSDSVRQRVAVGRTSPCVVDWLCMPNHGLVRPSRSARHILPVHRRFPVDIRRLRCPDQYTVCTDLVIALRYVRRRQCALILGRRRRRRRHVSSRVYATQQMFWQQLTAKRPITTVAYPVWRRPFLLRVADKHSAY